MGLLYDRKIFVISKMICYFNEDIHNWKETYLIWDEHFQKIFCIHWEKNIFILIIFQLEQQYHRQIWSYRFPFVFSRNSNIIYHLIHVDFVTGNWFSLIFLTHLQVNFFYYNSFFTRLLSLKLLPRACISKRISFKKSIISLASSEIVVLIF